MRFQKFIDRTYPEPNTGCWIWSGGQDRQGYGQVNFKVGNLRIWKAHRLSYYFHNGRFDESLCVCHTCDNPNCVNPEHLFLGTNADNMRDRNNKGRNYKGRRHVKLTESMVAEIRNKLTNGVKQSTLAKDYKTSPQNISLINLNKTW